MPYRFCARRLQPKLTGVGLVLAGVALVTACADRQTQVPLALVGIPGQINEHVSLASDGGSVVALTWAASSESSGSNVFAAVSADSGISFSPPVRVNGADSEVRVNGEQPPRVTLVPGSDGTPTVVVLWTARRAGATSLLYAESRDNGRSFGPERSVISEEVNGNRGWESMVATRDGRLFVLWLDHRESATATSAHAEHHHQAGSPATADGVARAQRSQLFVSAPDGSLPPMAIARGVCYCCKTAIAADSEGRVYAAWRHVYEGSHRDIAFTSSRDTAGHMFDEPVRVSADGWQLDGCPENGPALAVEGRRVHVLWSTLVRTQQETLQIFHASSLDGRTFTSRTPLPSSGGAAHPQLVSAPDGSLFAAWDELAAGARQVRVARGRASTNERFEFALGSIGDGAGAYPALASTRTHAILAWARPHSGTESRIAVTRLAYASFP